MLVVLRLKLEPYYTKCLSLRSVIIASGGKGGYGELVFSFRLSVYISEWEREWHPPDVAADNIKVVEGR
jgi:hypothetical protein